MKQRMIVQVILRDKLENILLLRRSIGNPNNIGQMELPGGAVKDSEQPEDALRRHVKKDTGLDLDNFRIKDALNMKDRENSEAEQMFIVYESNLFFEKPSLTIGSSFDRYEWSSLKDLKSYNLRDSAAMILNTLPEDNFSESLRQTGLGSRLSAFKHILYSDGGSRGNPGPSAAAFAIIDTDTGQPIEEEGVYLGITTNNQAEYHGLRLGIERAIERGILSLECRLDSMLVVNQLNGSYHIKNRELWPIFERIRSYIPQFEKITFVHIPRDENQKADSLVNQLLDQHQNETM